MSFFNKNKHPKNPDPTDAVVNNDSARDYTNENKLIQDLLNEIQTMSLRIPQIDKLKAEEIVKWDATQKTIQHLETEFHVKNELVLKNEIELQEIEQALKREKKKATAAQVSLLKIENTIQDVKAEIKRLTPELKKKIARRENLEKVFSTRNEKLKEIEKKEEKLSKEWKQANIQVLHLEAFLEEINPRLNLLEGSIEDIQKAHTETHTQLEKLLQVVEVKKAKEQSLDTEMAKTAFGIIQLQEELVKKTSLLEKLNAQINELEIKLQAPKQIQEDLQNNLRIKEKEHQQKKEYRDRLVFRLRELDEIINLLNQDLTKKDEADLELKKEESTLNDKIQTALTQVERYKKAIDFKVKALEEKNNEIIQLRVEYQNSLSEIEELSQMSEDLSEELTVNAALLQAKKERLDKAQKRREALAKNVEKKKTQLNTLN